MYVGNLRKEPRKVDQSGGKQGEDAETYIWWGKDRMFCNKMSYQKKND